MRNEEVTVRPWERQWNRVTHGETVRVERSAFKHTHYSNAPLVLHDISSTISPFLGEIDFFLLIYMHYHFEDCQNMGVRGICIVNLPLIFLVLIPTKMSAFPILFSNSYHKKMEILYKNRLTITFTVFIEVHNLINF